MVGLYTLSTIETGVIVRHQVGNWKAVLIMLLPFLLISAIILFDFGLFLAG